MFLVLGSSLTQENFYLPTEGLYNWSFKKKQKCLYANQLIHILVQNHMLGDEIEDNIVDKRIWYCLCN